MLKKDVFKGTAMLVVGLLVSVVVYPFLHEFGHVLAAWCVNAKVLKVTYFPVPSVLCEVGDMANIGKVIIGFGGMVFPMLVARLISQKWFAFWYARMLLQGISIMAFVISIVSILLRKNPQDDMVQVLQYWEYGRSMLLFILCVAVLLIIFLIVRDKPVKRLYEFWGV